MPQGKQKNILGLFILAKLLEKPFDVYCLCCNAQANAFVLYIMLCIAAKLEFIISKKYQSIHTKQMSYHCKNLCTKCVPNGCNSMF